MDEHIDAVVLSGHPGDHVGDRVGVAQIDLVVVRDAACSLDGLDRSERRTEAFQSGELALDRGRRRAFARQR